tara:strand:- start:790 stop:1041 length:252 start_codon:yes stop_codon:yes gene_type:complete
MNKALLIILIMTASIKLDAFCVYPKISYDGACWSHDSLQAHFDVNYPYDHDDEYSMSDFELEEKDTAWADEVLENIHTNNDEY